MSDPPVDLFELADSYLPGGKLGILTLPKGAKIIAASGQGPYLYSTEGKKYLDYLMGSGSVILGHSDSRVTNAVVEQLRKGTNFYLENDQAIKLAQLIISAVPCGEKIRFTSSGSEANYYAMRLARAFTGKDKILRFEGSYHGFYDYAMLSSQFADPKDLKAYPEVSVDSAGIPEALKDTMLAAPFNDIETTRQIINTNSDDLAAVVVEPLQRTIAPLPEFLQELREITEKKGLILIFDEIVTGFRLAYGGAQEYYGVEPDLACVGKSLAGGLPIGAVCGRSDIMDGLSPQGGYYGASREKKRVFMTGTFNGNPLSCSAGLATLEGLRGSGVYEKLNSFGDTLRTELTTLFEKHKVTAQVHGDGSVTGFTFTDREVIDYRSQITGDTNLRQEVAHGLLEHSVFAPYKMYSSLAHSNEHLTVTIEAFEETLKSLKVSGILS